MQFSQAFLFVVLGFLATKSYGSDIGVGFLQFLINQESLGEFSTVPPNDEITPSTISNPTPTANQTTTTTTTTTVPQTATTLITTIQQEATTKAKKTKPAGQKNSMKITLDCANFCKRKGNGEYKGFCNKRRNPASCLFCRYVFNCGRSARLFS